MVRPLSASVLLGLFVVLGVASADATELVSLQVQIPFSFRVGEKTLAPGEYSVRFDGVELQGVLRVQALDGRGGALIQTLKAEIPRDKGNEPKLIFEKNGSEYVLTQVLGPGHYGIEVLSGRHRGEAERIAILAN